MGLFEFFIRRPVFASVMSLMLTLIGAVSFQQLTVRQYPNIDEPIVSVNTSYPGASAEVVEERITQIIEQQVAGIQGIDQMSSSSRDGTSRISTVAHVR